MLALFILRVPALFILRDQVGFLFTYVAPLVFVLTITVVKEGYDDFQRYKRDAAGQTFQQLNN